MIKRLLPNFAAALLLVMSACTTNKLAQHEDQVDDVYYTKAKAKEYNRTYAQAEEKTSRSEYVTDEELYGDEDGYYDRDYSDRDYSDRDYSARIYRFRNYSPWRSYYDTWYDYRFDPYYSRFNSYNYYNRPSFGIYIGYGGYRYNNFYNPWNYYGSQYYGSYWGPYSYYNTYNPYFYGNRYYGNYGGGYYGNNGRPVIVNPNYRTRPNRETDNIRSGNNYPGRTQGANDRIGTYPSRPERNVNGSSGRPAAGSADRPSSVDRSSQPDRTNARPTRSNDSRPSSVDRGSSRPAPAPQRTETARPSRPERTESRPAERQQSSPPPSSAPQRSSDQGSSSRPSRTGGR